MLTELHIRNFKGWRDSQPIALAPLTVLFGSNSCGKTSVHQLLLLLKQTEQSPDRRRVLHLGDENTLVDLGTYEDVIHDHDVSQPLWFAVGWRPSSPVALELGAQGTLDADELRFEAEIAPRPDGTLRVCRAEYVARRAGVDELRLTMSETEKPGEYDLAAWPLRLVRRKGRAWPLPAPKQFHGFPPEAVAYFQNAEISSDLQLQLERMLQSIDYVGPLREYPRRTYTWSGEAPDHVGVRGERAVEALLGARERKISRGPHKRSETFHELVARWLVSLGLIESFEARPIAKGRKEHEVVVRTRAGAPEVRVTDVGFGVSQILPVLVECFCVPRGSTVIFEQPEIHLHPRVQSGLADLFLEAIHSREEGQDRQVQFLVESHSEHFLRRLQRRVAEGVVPASDVAIYFASASGGASRLDRLELDALGNISNWPENFFGDEVAELQAMVEAQARRAEEGT
jgi:predicted ATPase